MIINGEKLKTLDVFPTMMTVPDCMVVTGNKLGGGHGEAKIYVASKNAMHEFYGAEGFEAKCFLLKKDLVSYMEAIKFEYFKPTQDYTKKNEMPTLWQERMRKIAGLNDVIFFNVYDQNQITGIRGYVNSKDEGYKIIRELALPLISYIYVEKLSNGKQPLYYWKLFVDFDAIWEKKNGPLVFNYGKKKNQPIEDNENEETIVEKIPKKVKTGRDGQSKYREKLLEQCPFCPFTGIADDRLLIASHIKPWVAADDKEKIDPYNGYMLSPLYDKLFDRGFMTFTENRHVILSSMISPRTWKQIKLENNEFIQRLPMDDKRIEYLKYHQNNVFKGSL